MLKRGTQTDQLKNVIQVLQLGRKSGILTVICQGDVIEEGRIAFVHGQITEVQLGQLSGQPALNIFLKRRCRFVFVEVETNTEPQLLYTPVPPPTPAPPAPAFPMFRRSPDQSLTTPQLPSIKQGARPHSQVLPENRERGRGSIAKNQLQDPSVSLTIPSRVLQDDESFRYITQARLSRMHMHLFLLIDGERTPLNLARLLNRSKEEVERMLYDLETIHVINQ
jgi:hypothetical protein